ncbi:hypothetical protein QYF36_023773 [Acer negundo]|nr:hypothetical protein QYF36_023773 [Acer negundo]
MDPTKICPWTFLAPLANGSIDNSNTNSQRLPKPKTFVITKGGPSGMLNEKEAMQIAQKVDAIEIVTFDNEEEIEEFQILNHAINASDQFGNNPIINVGNMVSNSTINPEKDFISNQVIDSTTQESAGNQVNDSTTQKSASNQVSDSTTQKSLGNQFINHLPCKDILLNNDYAINMDDISDIYSNDQID